MKGGVPEGLPAEPPQQIAGLSHEGKGKTAESNRRRHSGKAPGCSPSPLSASCLF